MVKLLRQKSQNVIAFGACAVMGGIPALATLKNRDSIIQRAYLDPDVAENPERTTPQRHSDVPGTTLELPEFYETVYKLNDIIEVEYYLPGCPPTTSIILPALEALLAGKTIPHGTVLAPNHALCKSCDLNSTKPDRPTLKALKRVYEIQADAAKCFLAQGIICMGPATRDGCGALCIHGHMPCTGCFGPCQDMDQGAKMVGALGGIYDTDTADGIQTMTRSVVDPAGTFYRYGLSASLLGAKRKENRNG
jgi:F420-non-reducing hydrogenase small subunit